MLRNAFLIEVLHVIVALLGVVLSGINVKESIQDVRALVVVDGKRDPKVGMIALERLITALFVHASQIVLITVAMIGVFSAPPPPGIEASAPTPFRASYLVLETSSIVVSALLGVKSLVRLRYRRKVLEASA